jgi:hypothetical protein
MRNPASGFHLRRQFGPRQGRRRSVNHLVEHPRDQHRVAVVCSRRVTAVHENCYRDAADLRTIVWWRRSEGWLKLDFDGEGKAWLFRIARGNVRYLVSLTHLRKRLSNSACECGLVSFASASSNVLAPLRKIRS